jgi:Ser/Thr protein kinase RdoA (MazF antagonist)
VQALGGTAAPKWDVACAQGRFVVRVRPAEFSGDSPTGFDHAALVRLRAAGFPVPSPVACPDGATVLRRDGRTYEVLHWVEGAPFGEGALDAVGALGEFLARLHLALGTDPPAGKEGWLREDHPDRLEPYLAELYGLAPDAAARGQLDRVGQQLRCVREHLDSGLYAALPQAVIHGDFHPGNVRFRGPQVAAVYDFDYLSVQARARDVSDALIFFASTRTALLDPDRIRSLTQPFWPDRLRCRLLLQGYQGSAGLTEREWEALPLLIRSRWIQMRLRGARKVAPEDKVAFVLDRFAEGLDWLDHQADAFFGELRSEE